MRRITVTSEGMALLTVALAVPAYAQIADHLECYKVRDPLKLEAFVDLDSPQFGLAPSCKVGKATLFCAPAKKTVLSAVDNATGLPITPLPLSGPNAGDRICYQVKCPEPFPPDQSATDQFGTRTLTKFQTQLLCTPAFKGSARFVDNLDGTVTDNYTGLQWEQKTTVVGSGANLADPHDVDNPYNWGNLDGCPFTGCPNGPAFTDFLGRLNNCTTSDGTEVTTAGFAGHCDWRLPTIQELKTIVDLTQLTQGNCGGSSGVPCIDPVFGPTVADAYWSVTTDASDPVRAYGVLFQNTTVFSGPKNSFADFYVRAVRAGS